MKQIRLVQVGDIHFPEAQSASVMADWKDKGFPEALAFVSSAQALQASMRALIRYCFDETVLLFLCGDLTTFGVLEQYKLCLSWLKDNLELDSERRWPKELLHATPGNHDVDRTLADDVDIYAKFQPLEEAWEQIGRPILATRTTRRTVIDREGCRLHVHSLNSCIGCGERRHLPTGQEDDFQTVLDRYMEIQQPLNGSGWSYEQLDTPAIDESVLTTLVEDAYEAGPRATTIVLGHHNLLPQVRPRYQIYSGLTRARFSSCPSSVLYLHGHIHEDPIEVVEQFNPSRGRVLAISAPLLLAGFNVIDIEFSDSGDPLGCTVIPLRLQRHGQVAPENGIRIALHSGMASDPIVSAISKVVEPNIRYRFEDVRKLINEETKSRYQKKRIASALLEAEWLGLVEVVNRSDDMSRWQIMRSIP